MARGTADVPPLEMTKWFAATVKLTSAFRQPSIKAAIRAVDLGKSELDPLGIGLVQSERHDLVGQIQCRNPSVPVGSLAGSRNGRAQSHHRLATPHL